MFSFFPFDYIQIALLVTAFVNFLLGLIILGKGPRERINRVYAINILAIIGWILGMFLYRQASAQKALFWTRVLYVTPTFIASTFLYFTYIFPKPDPAYSRFKNFLIFLGNALIIGLVLHPTLIIKDVATPQGQEKQIFWGNFYFLYALYIAGYFTFGFWRIFKKFISSTDWLEKRQIFFFLFGYFLAANFAMITNLIMPWFGHFELNWLGQIFTFLMVGFTTHAILKFHLFNARLLATEVLVAAITLPLFVEIFFARSRPELYFRIIFFFLTSLLGALVLQSVFLEVKRREEMKRLVDQLEEANKKLQELDKAKTDFISIVSHQLRTPLTVIHLGALSLLEGIFGEIKEEKQKIALQKIVASSEHLISLVNTFLNISRIELGKIEYTFQPVNLAELIKDVFEELKPRAERKNLILECHFEENLPLLQLDKEKMREVFINLIDNAIKYTDQGKISCGLKKENQEIVFYVKDTGHGLTKEELVTIFQKFHRGGTSLSRERVEGSGFGLFVAKTFVEAQGGKIWAESDGPNTGSTFFVKFPLLTNQKSLEQDEKIDKS